MFSLLDPRLWGAIGLAVALSFAAGFWKGNTHGKAAVRAEWLESRHAADQESRRLEQARQRRADEAAKLAAARSNRLAADNRRARNELDGMRDDLSAARHYAEQSRAAAERVARLSTELFGECSREYLEMAEAAQRADNYARQLIEAWPR